MTTATTERTKAMVGKMASRLAEALRGDDQEELASRVERAAAKVAANDDGAYWGLPRLQPKMNAASSVATVAQVVLLEQLQADGLSDEACDPIRDTMFDLF